MPLFFVPLGRLKHEDWFMNAVMTKLQEELLLKYVEHNFHWLNDLLDLRFTGSWKTVAIKPFYKLFTSIARHKIKQVGVNAKL